MSRTKNLTPSRKRHINLSLWDRMIEVEKFHKTVEPTFKQNVRFAKKNMKLIFAIGAALLFSFQASASDTLSTKIKRATVFLSGAQVFRQSKTITVPKGVNEFIIKDVSPYVNQNQLQATALGSFLILDVQFINEYVPPGTVKPTIVQNVFKKKLRLSTIPFYSFLSRWSA